MNFIHNMTHAKKKILPVVTPLFLIACAIAFFYQQQQFKSRSDRQFAYISGQAQKSPTVVGYHFSGIRDGIKIISIKAAKHSIKKMKMGFISVGTNYIAIYKNAVIDIHLQQHKTHGPENRDTLRIPAYSFDAIFAEEVMPIFSIRNLTALLFQPVRINFYSNQSLLCRLEAESASIKPKDSKISTLKNRVSAKSDFKRLTTDRLTLIAAKGMIKANDRFALKTAENLITGKKIVVSLNLEAVTEMPVY